MLTMEHCYFNYYEYIRLEEPKNITNKLPTLITFTFYFFIAHIIHCKRKTVKVIIIYLFN